MGREAVSAALKDSKLKYEDVQAVVASYCYGDPACGQRVVYGEGVLLAG
jgi:sterol carrier protein 2